MPCPTCGATDGIVLDADGNVSSCRTCDETDERTERKDQIDIEALRKAAREPVKNVIDLSLKAAGVAIAARALIQKTVTQPDGTVYVYRSRAPEQHELAGSALWQVGLRSVDSLGTKPNSEYWVLPLRNGHLIEIGHVPQRASMLTYFECLSNLGLSFEEFELLIGRRVYGEDVVFLLCVIHLLEEFRYSNGLEALRRLDISTEVEKRFLMDRPREWNEDELKALRARRKTAESLDYPGLQQVLRTVFAQIQ